jgi:hypothetical protein
MSPKKTKSRNSDQVRSQAQLRPQIVQPTLTSDYETDTNNASDFVVSGSHLPSLQKAPPIRTTAELNLIVLCRHNPSVSSILSIAPYAVIYTFSPATQQWEKHGIEGTLFVCQLTPSPQGAERYSVTVLNRRGLNNFSTELRSTGEVEVTEEYVILQISGEDGTVQVFGVWIFPELAPSSTVDTRTINAQIIHACAAQAEASRKIVEAKQNAQDAADGANFLGEKHQEPQVEAVAMGRQLSLRELFGQVREQDDGWSVHNHHSQEPLEDQAGIKLPPPEIATGRTTQFTTTADTEFFRNVQRHAPSTRMMAPSQNTQRLDILNQLFRKAT